MGYWRSAPNGASFAQDSDLVWGDHPADIMEDALDHIVMAFNEDVGRLPSPAEIRAGLNFSLALYEEKYDRLRPN